MTALILIGLAIAIAGGTAVIVWIESWRKRDEPIRTLWFEVDANGEIK